MKDNTNEIQLFVQEQVALELELSKIIELVLELDEYDFKSSNEFYKNKNKYDILIDYSIKLNNYDYAKFEYYYNILSENMPEGREMLDDFILKLQDIIFDLNVVLNTYIENIINHEMAMDLLDKKSGEVNLREISFHVGNLDIISKRKYTDKKICELVGVKAFSGAFNNLTKSPYKNIILDFYFNRTKGKFNSLTDYKKISTF